MLVGRSDDCAVLRELVSRLHDGGSGALVLAGEPGTGKTLLLQRILGSVTAVTTASTAGSESEVQLDFAGLHRFLLPHLGRRRQLSGPHRRALEVTFGLRDGTAPDQCLVGLAVLALLSEVASTQPLLCLIDDAQWLDPKSQQVLGFVARRLHTHPIGMVFAAREHTGDLSALDGLPVRRLGPLDRTSAREILHTAAPGALHPRVSERIIDETDGNPLAMLELVELLTVDQLAGRFPLPPRLPVGPQVSACFRPQLAVLPPRVRTAVLVAAASCDDEPATMWRAATMLRVPAESINHAVAQGILSAYPRITFRHNLLRSVIYADAAPGERRRVHRALAAIADDDGKRDLAAWHRSATATVPDDGIAAELAQSAPQAQRRGGFPMQAEFLTRSAQLSTDAMSRATRYLAAARAHLSAGDALIAEALLDQAAPVLADSGHPGAVQRLRAAISMFFCHHKDAPAVLLEAASRVAVADASSSRQILCEAMAAAVVAGHYTEGTTLQKVTHAVLAITRDPAYEATIEDLLLDGLATRLAHGYTDAVPLLRAAVAKMSTDVAVVDADLLPTDLGWIAADDVWDDQGCRAMFARAAAGERRQGALRSLHTTLAGLATSQAWSGQLDDAERSHREAADVSDLIGMPSGGTGAVLLHVRAWQGREDEARRLATRALGWSRETGSHTTEIATLAALTVMEIGLGRYSEALRCSEQIFGEDPPGFGNRILSEIVEAGVRGGDRPAAQAALARLTDRATASSTPWALGVLARSKALMADDVAAEPYYRQAIEHLTATSVRTELARAHLLYGEWLRRRKRRREAQTQLQTAHHMFTAMGAGAFAARARLECRAAGIVAHEDFSPINQFGLTPQEVQVARSAGDGVTNAEIATRLFITKSTVEYHLSKVFRKLGVTSRRQLLAALSEDVERSPRAG